MHMYAAMAACLIMLYFGESMELSTPYSKLYVIKLIKIKFKECCFYMSLIFLFQVLEGMEMTKDEFVDLCILLGCDYCDKIKGIGPKNALKLIQVNT
jgi:5'-3' exonuclease